MAITIDETVINGEKLYAKYKRANEEAGCGVDSWHELEESDREAWNAMAYDLLWEIIQS